MSDNNVKKGTIHIGRKAIILSYIRYFINIFSQLIILPVILYNISQEEYGLWGIFLSIDAGIGLIELGLGTVITRYVTYAFCGASAIPMSGLPPVMNEGVVNTSLLFDVVYVSKKIYKRITIISSILFAIASIYIVYLSMQVDNKYGAIMGWTIFCGGCLFRIYFTFYSSFIKGIGKIKETEKIHILSGVIYMATRLLFTWMGWGLIGLGIANALDIILVRFLIFATLNDFLSENKEDVRLAKKRTKEGVNDEISKAIWKNSKQLGVATITNYLTGQGKVLLCSTILPLSVMGQFNLTNQVVSTVANVSMIPYTVFRIQMGDSIVKKEKSKTKEIFSFMLLFFFLIMLIGSIVTLLFGEKVVLLIRSNTTLLEKRYVFLLLLYAFVVSLNQICTGYISLKNIQPYIMSYVIAGISGILCAYLVFLIIQRNALDCYVYATLASQLIYNAWKWPLYVYRDTGLRIRDIVVSGTKYFIRMAKGEVR